MKTLLFRGVSKIFQREGSHFITPMLLTRWVCLHPLEVIFFRMSSARWEEGGGATKQPEKMYCMLILRICDFSPPE